MRSLGLHDSPWRRRRLGHDFFRFRVGRECQALAQKFKASGCISTSSSNARRDFLVFFRYVIQFTVRTIPEVRPAYKVRLDRDHQGQCHGLMAII